MLEVHYYCYYSTVCDDSGKYAIIYIYSAIIITSSVFVYNKNMI